MPQTLNLNIEEETDASDDLYQLPGGAGFSEVQANHQTGLRDATLSTSPLRRTEERSHSLPAASVSCPSLVAAPAQDRQPSAHQQHALLNETRSTQGTRSICPDSETHTQQGPHSLVTTPQAKLPGSSQDTRPSFWAAIHGSPKAFPSHIYNSS